MNKIAWYINRMRTMSFPEIGYRAGQYYQKQKEKKGIFNFSHTNQDYDQVLAHSQKSVIATLPPELMAEMVRYTHFEFFGYTLDLSGTIDWHLDISSRKHFPLSFSKDIDIRSDRFGSAKVVWEINRLQFLLPMAIGYSLSKDKKHLTHWMQLMTSWIRDNPYLTGINWYSNIEINIRLIVWYFCWQIFWQDEELKDDKEFTSFVTKTWLPSIYEHCVYSHVNPSKYSSANNHLVAEYSGLFIASCCWNFKEAEKWKSYAQEGLEKEIRLQYSRNGINHEQAAEYIQFITDFFLIPYAAGISYHTNFSEGYKRCLYNISNFIYNLLDVKNNYRKYGDEDDGKVLVVSTDPHFDNFSSILTSAAVLFNEPHFKSKGSFFDLKNWLLWGEPGKKKFEEITLASQYSTSAFYRDEGHFIFRKMVKEEGSREIYMHLDAAPLGFLSIAAHGHADALSVSLSVDGYPIIVDVGTYTYHTEKKWRDYFVSTLAHNTICLDDNNQAQQAGPTMWLQHYETNVLEMEQNDSFETVSAEHSGYKKIGCSHKRNVRFDRFNNSFDIIDAVGVSSKEHTVYQPWHLHPDVVIQVVNSHEYILRNINGGRSVLIRFDNRLQLDNVKGQTNPVLGWYSKSFLAKEPTAVIMGKIKTSGKQEVLLNTLIHVLE